MKVIENIKTIDVITIGSNVSYWRSGDYLAEDYMRLFIINSEHYFNSVIERRGYLYLNQIYEYLKIEWSPSNYNVCFTSSIEFEVFPLYEDGILNCLKLRVRHQ